MEPKGRAWGTSPIQQRDMIDWDKLEEWARENVACIVCGRKANKSERIKLHLMPDPETRTAEVRLAHFTCFGYEDDGVTPRKNRVIVPIAGGLRQ